MKWAALVNKFHCFFVGKVGRGDMNAKNRSLTSVIINQYAVLLYAYPLLNTYILPLLLHCLLSSSAPMEQQKTKLSTSLSIWKLTSKTTIFICTNSYPELPATSAALCLIISITAALRRESDCCCSLLKCSCKSLQRGTWHADSLHALA